jgi:uncharacterized protein (TIRG00374 family)
VVAWAWLWESLVRLVTRFGKVARFRTKLLDTRLSLADLVTPSRLLVGNALSIVAWGLQGASLAYVARAFPGVSLTLPHALAAYSAPVLAGTLAMIPGGLGLTEFSMTGALERLGGPAMTVSVAAAVTILVRLVTFWLAILIGFAALFVWHSSKSVRPVEATHDRR